MLCLIRDFNLFLSFVLFWNSKLSCLSDIDIDVDVDSCNGTLF